MKRFEDFFYFLFVIVFLFFFCLVMELLAQELVAHGYELPPAEESAFVVQLRRLIELSKLVESATLRLTTLQSQANFEDLVNPIAIERKQVLLAELDARIASVLAGKDKILAFVQRNHSLKGHVLAIDASKQLAMVSLFESMSSQLRNESSLLASVEWAASEKALVDLDQGVQATLGLLTQYQARYQRAFEANESLTSAIERKMQK